MSHRKHLNYILIFLIGFVGCSVNKSEAVKDNATAKVEKYYGEWRFKEIVKVLDDEQYPDKEVLSLIKESITINKQSFSKNGSLVNNPVYIFDEYPTGYPQVGVVHPKSLSIFWGYKPERKIVELLKVYLKPPVKDDLAECVFEVISNNEILSLNAGRISIYEKVK